MLSVIILLSIINVIFTIRMNVIRLSVIRLNVIMLNVVAPQKANANILTENWKLEQESKNIFSKKIYDLFQNQIRDIFKKTLSLLNVPMDVVS